MGATISRPRILTLNEKVGGFDETAPGGVWMVTRMATGTVCHLFSNRQAAEDYIYWKAAQNACPLEFWELQVWAVSDTWPDEDDE